MKGFRYELWCLGRLVGARFCSVFCPEPGSGASSSCSSLGAGHVVGRWPRALFDDLAARVEPPDPRNRWEQPLFVADARRPRSPEEGSGAAAVRPAPASLPAGGRGAAVEERIGWPLDAVAAAVVAAVAAPGRAREKAESDAAAAAAAVVAAAPGETSTSSSAAAAAAAPPHETLPLATTSVALRPAKCTLAARVAGADALGDLDAAAQAVLLAVAAALSSLSSSSSSKSKNGAPASASAAQAPFAAIEIPLAASSAGAQEEEEAGKNRLSEQDPLTLSLRRAPSLAELRRHKRDFLRAATAPMAGPLPTGARAGASAFCEYLKRRVV